jgi:hypothetical protein
MKFFGRDAGRCGGVVREFCEEPFGGDAAFHAEAATLADFDEAEFLQPFEATLGSAAPDRQSRGRLSNAKGYPPVV